LGTHFIELQWLGYVGWTLLSQRSPMEDYDGCWWSDIGCRERTLGIGP